MAQAISGQIWPVSDGSMIFHNVRGTQKVVEIKRKWLEIQQKSLEIFENLESSL
jgi:hypothetical protein